MKKKTKKLTLSRETIINLELSVGVVTYTNQPDFCDSAVHTCATCANTCTSNRC